MEKELTVRIEVQLAADINFTVNAEFLKIRKGQTGYLVLSAEPVEGFVGDLSFSVDPPPDEFLVSFPNGNTVTMDGISTKGVAVNIYIGADAEVKEHVLKFRVTGEHTGS